MKLFNFKRILLNPPKFRAGILIYALVISLLTLILLLGFLQLFLYSNQEKLTIFRVERTNDLLLSGIEYLTAFESELTDTSFSIDLFNDGNSDLILCKKEYGFFDILKAQCIIGKDTFSKIAIPGFYDPGNQTALQMGSSIYELKIGGDALLEGDVYVPERGISRANTGNKSYHRDSLVYGIIHKTSGQIPELNKRIRKLNLEYLKNYFQNSSVLERDIYTHKYENSFADVCKMIKLTASNRKFQDTLIGNFILYSDDSISVETDAYLENTLVFAPKIIIKEGFNGKAQFIASDTLIVEKKVRLLFPSVLIINSQNKEKLSRLILNEESIIQGVIIYTKEIVPNIFSPAIPVLWIGEKCKIWGIVYCSHAVYLQGTILGSLYCPQFTDLSQGINENLLIDGQISRRKKPEIIPDFQLFEKRQRTKIIQWLK